MLPTGDEELPPEVSSLEGVVLMEPVDSSAIQSRVRSLEDADLQRMVTLERAEWRTEALEFARQEMQRRGLPPMTDEEYLAAHPEDALGASGLCQSCEESELTPLGLSPLLMFFLGFRAIPDGDPCPHCRTQVVRLWWPLIPLVPLGRYLVPAA